MCCDGNSIDAQSFADYLNNETVHRFTALNCKLGPSGSTATGDFLKLNDCVEFEVNDFKVSTDDEPTKDWVEEKISGTDYKKEFHVAKDVFSQPDSKGVKAFSYIDESNNLKTISYLNED